MAPEQTAVMMRTSSELTHTIDPAQTRRAATALLRKIQSDKTTRDATTGKPSLLADADDNDAEENIPIWLILTTKKHVTDKDRLKPGKIVLPHPILDASNSNLRICLITADPQRTYKELIAHPSFPLEVAKKIGRVIGITKLKAKYKSFESRRQLLGEYDVFLADDRIITYLPKLLGKVFYKSGTKRPVPISLQGRRQNFDEQGNKRRKLSEGGSKVVKSEVKPTDVAREIERALSSALVHLAPSTSTAVKVGKASMEPQQLQENVEIVMQVMVDRYVPQKWKNLRAVHIKGPETAALPIWMAEELWEDEKDVLEEVLPVKETKNSKKRKRGTLADAATEGEGSQEVIEVPGPDGKMRRLEKSSVQRRTEGESNATLRVAKKRRSEMSEDIDTKSAEKAEKAARKEALQKQKAAAKAAVNGVEQAAEVEVAQNGDKKTAKKTRKRVADTM